jgi:hypothetical protein
MACKFAELKVHVADWKAKDVNLGDTTYDPKTKNFTK